MRSNEEKNVKIMRGETKRIEREIESLLEKKDEKGE